MDEQGIILYNILIFHIGKVAGWKDHFSEEMSKKLDEWIDREASKYGLDVTLLK